MEGNRLNSGQKFRTQLRSTPSSALVVPKEDIEDSRGYNLEDVFQFSPGVYVQSRSGGADSKLSIRGTNLSSNFNNWGVTLLINGLPMNTADGFSTFDAIDLLAVDHIEVYKGANALRFGSSTLGGAVNFILRTGTQASRLRVKTEGGRYDFYNTQISSGSLLDPFTLAGQSATADYYVSATASGQHGFRTNNQQDALRLFTNVGLQIGDHQQLRLYVAKTNIATDFPGLLTLREMEANRQQAGADPDVAVNPLNCQPAEPCRHAEYTQLHYVGLAYQNEITPHQTFTIAPFYQYWIQDVSRAQKLYFVNQDYGAEFRFTQMGTIGDKPGQLVVGFSPRLGESRTSIFINDFGNRGTMLQGRFTQTVNLGAYAEGQLDLLPDFTLVLGGRLVHSYRNGRVTNSSPPGTPSVSLQEDRVFSAVTPKIGLVYRMTPTAQLFGNISRVYEPPINIQLIQALDVNALPPNQAFIDLDAQRGWQFELGYRGSAMKGDVRWDLTVFDLELRNEHLVTELTIPGVGEVPTFTNAKKTRHTGLEIGGAAVLGRGLLIAAGGPQSDQLTMRLAYTWSRYRFLDDQFKVSGGAQVLDAGKGKTIPGVPDHWLSGELRYNYPNGFWIAPNFLWSPTGYFVDFQNTVKNPPFFIVNLKAGWQITKQVNVHVEGRNLTNQNYAGSVAAGGFNSNITSPRAYLPSSPISVFAGLEFQLD